MASRRIIDLTEADLEALIERRLAAAIAELQAERAPLPALVDRAGLAKALSCSTKTVDRLRAEPNFPEERLYETPKFCVADVVAFIKGPRLRVVGGAK